MERPRVGRWVDGGSAGVEVLLDVGRRGTERVFEA